MRKHISKSLRWLISHALTVFSCVAIIALGMGAVAYSSTSTTIGNNIFTSGTLSVSSNSTLATTTISGGDLIVNTDTLFVDSANSRVGIGTTSPAHKLSVAGNVVADSFIATSTTDTSTFAGPIGLNGLLTSTVNQGDNLWRTVSEIHFPDYPIAPSFGVDTQNGLNSDGSRNDVVTWGFNRNGSASHDTSKAMLAEQFEQGWYNGTQKQAEWHLNFDKPGGTPGSPLPNRPIMITMPYDGLTTTEDHRISYFGIRDPYDYGDGPGWFNVNKTAGYYAGTLNIGAGATAAGTKSLTIAGRAGYGNATNDMIWISPNGPGETGDGTLPSSLGGLLWGQNGGRINLVQNSPSYNSNSHMEFWVNNGTSLTESVRILSNGNVGIGTAAPTSKLHIYNTDTTNTVTQDLKVGHAGGGAWGQGTSIGMFAGGMAEEAARIETVNDVSLGASLRFYTRQNSVPTEKMRITNTGNVGIGTTTPATTLDVNGIIKTQPASSRTCNALAEGGIMYNSDDNHFYGCNGSAWVQLDN